MYHRERPVRIVAACFCVRDGLCACLGLIFIEGHSFRFVSIWTTLVPLALFRYANHDDRIRYRYRPPLELSQFVAERNLKIQKSLQTKDGQRTSKMEAPSAASLHPRPRHPDTGRLDCHIGTTAQAVATRQWHHLRSGYQYSASLADIHVPILSHNTRGVVQHLLVMDRS